MILYIKVALISAKLFYGFFQCCGKACIICLSWKCMLFLKKGIPIVSTYHQYQRVEQQSLNSYSRNKCFCYQFEYAIYPNKLTCNCWWQSSRWRKMFAPSNDYLFIEFRNLGNLRKSEVLTFKFEWTLNFFPKYWRIRWSGINCHWWKLLSNNLFIQEHCKLTIFERISTFFRPPYS